MSGLVSEENVAGFMSSSFLFVTAGPLYIITKSSFLLLEGYIGNIDSLSPAEAMNVHGLKAFLKH